MAERPGAVTMKGNPLTLVGDEVRVGQNAPDFTAVDTDLKPLALSSLRGKVVVIASVPSLDTPVCDIETRRFNQEAAGLGKDVRIRDLALLIAGGKKERVNFVKHHHPQSEIMKLLCDNSKARRVLGWRPRTPLKEGIEKTKKWIEENEMREG